MASMSSMTVFDLAAFLAENHLLLHVIRLKPAKVFTAVLESTALDHAQAKDAKIFGRLERFEASSRDPADAVERAMAAFETWLQGKPRNNP